MKKLLQTFFILSMISISSCKKDIAIAPAELEGWSKMEMYGDYTIWFPDRIYSVGTFSLDDAWGFSGNKNDGNVSLWYQFVVFETKPIVFSSDSLPNNIGTANPIILSHSTYSDPMTLSRIYSVFTKEEIGVVYTSDDVVSNEKEILFFFKTDYNYELVLEGKYSVNELEEVKLILSTIEVN